MFGQAVKDGFSRNIRRFAGDRSGNFALAFAAASSMIVLTAGYAVNTVQLFNVKSQLSHALDSAITSTARDITTGTIEADDARRVVEIFLRANMGNGFADADAVNLDTLVVDPVAQTVGGTATVDVPIAFPLFGSSDTRRVGAESVAAYSDRRIEVAMMLDVTGSMGGRKIEDLKEAAELAVTTMLDGQNGAEPRIRVALVPYAEAVNVGSALARETVFEETSGGSDLPPARTAPILASGSSRTDNCATERKLSNGRADHTDLSPYSDERRDSRGRNYVAKVNRDDRLRVCPTARMVPLTADSRALLSSIRNFKADGVTAGGIAAQWGYYMLSPNWRAAVRNAGLGAGPANHDERSVAKIAILMTDGQFNTAFAGGSGKPQLEQGAASRANAEAICANMKRDGIQVFTIGFDLNNPGMKRSERDQAKSVLKNCASPDTSRLTHYYEAATGEDLSQAFLDIIANIERLAIVR